MIFLWFTTQKEAFADMADSNRIKHLSNFICLKEITYKERTCFHLRKGNVFKKENKRRMDLTFFAKETKKRGAIVQILWISWIQKGVLSHFPSYPIPPTYTYTQRHIPYSFTICYFFLPVPFTDDQAKASVTFSWSIFMEKTMWSIKFSFLTGSHQLSTIDIKQIFENFEWENRCNKFGPQNVFCMKEAVPFCFFPWPHSTLN